MGTNARTIGIASLMALSCLDVLGDIEVVPLEAEILPIKEGIAADAGACEDGGIAQAACLVSCSPGEVRCSDALLLRCNELGSRWDLVDQCASHALCDADGASCRAPACASRQHLCTEQGELLICKADRTGFEHEDQCQSAAHCNAASGREGCEGVACRAGRQRCNGAQIEQCRPDRSGFDVIGEPCASAALCREGESPFARCEIPVCTAGQFECSGPLLMRCADDANSLLEIRPCASEQLCNAASQRCEEPVCAIGQQRCRANVLERCNAAQTSFAAVETCPSALLCDPSSPSCLATPPDPPVLGTAPYTFVDASSSAALGLGPLSLVVPSEWADVDRGPYRNAAGEVLGPLFVASTNAPRFSSSFDIPGVYFAATARAPIDIDARLAELDMSARCTRGASMSYDDGLYFGVSQTWNDCASTKATTVVVVAVPANEAFLTIVIVTLLAERDQEARRRIWETFVVEPRTP